MALEKVVVVQQHKAEQARFHSRLNHLAGAVGGKAHMANFPFGLGLGHGGHAALGILHPGQVVGRIQAVDGEAVYPFYPQPF